MLAAVDDFLLGEGADFARQLVGHTVAVRLHRLDEHRLALWKGHRQRGVEGRGDGVAVQPPAPLPVVAAEAAIARRDRKVLRGRRVRKAGHMFLGSVSVWQARERLRVAYLGITYTIGRASCRA